jgi:hypothetical protein
MDEADGAILMEVDTYWPNVRLGHINNGHEEDNRKNNARRETLLRA